MNLNNYLNHMYKFVLFMFALTFLYDPTFVGEWKAQMDIGYDMIWSEYLMDYSCGEEN